MSSSRSSSPTSESQHRSSADRRTGSCTVQWAGGVTARAALLIGSGHEKVIGPRFIRLLRLVAEEGSLRGAARALGMGSRHAVAWVQRAEALLGCELAERRVGGAHGGGARLTPAGAALIATYERVSADLAEYLRAAERDFIPASGNARGVRGRAVANRRVAPPSKSPSRCDLD